MTDSSAVKTAPRRNGFSFKQFFVGHDRCAMKVGTDGVLLGAWAPLPASGRVLDIGTGCGLIALMLTQRAAGQLPVDAVELDEAAAGQAAQNVAASPWPDSVRVIQRDILHHVPDRPGGYELIVSNPPYFPAGTACASDARDRARYTSSLSHADLLTTAQRLISPTGRLALVLPLEIGQALIIDACQQGWYLHHSTQVAENEQRPPQRLLLTLSRQPGEVVRSAMVLRDEHRAWSPAFRSLAAAFFLAM